MKKSATTAGESRSRLIDARIEELGDWRGKMLSQIRALIKQADPEVIEEVKWKKPSNRMAGVPVWSHAGIICTGETYKSIVKVTFAKCFAQGPVRTIQLQPGRQHPVRYRFP